MPSEFAHRASLTLFGIGVVFESNCRRALDAARACIASNKTAHAANVETSCVYIVIARDVVNVRDAPSDHVDSHALSLTFGRTVIVGDPVKRHGTCLFADDEPGGPAFDEAINTLVLYLVAHAGR